MQLISPNGVLISVSDDKGERLLANGDYREPASEPAPVVSAPRPRPRSRKNTTD
jgi:hypothetical protein